MTKTKIAKKTVSALRGDRGLTGPQGPQGSQGPQGKPGSDATINGVAAGGDLTGTYPNPSIGLGKVGWEKLSPQVSDDLRTRPWFPVATYGPFENGWHDLGGDYARAAWAEYVTNTVYLKGVITGGTVPSDVFTMLCAGPDDLKTHVFATVSGTSLAKVEVRSVADPGCSYCPFEPQYCSPPSDPTPKDAIIRVTFGSNAAVTLDGISWHTGKLTQE